MKPPRDNVPVEVINSRLEYNPDDGVFTWKQSPRKRWAGKVAGYKRKDGYIIINIDKNLCLAHRLVWVLTYGKWPSTGVDHINGVPSDNRLINLREATPEQNHWNHKILQTNNTSGYRGVTYHRKTGKWVAEIWHKRKKYYLGLFSTKEDASVAHECARSRMFGSFNRVLPEQTVNFQ